MSTTATTQEVRHILSDYTIHLTGSNSEAPLPQEESNTISSVQNPPNWPTDRRRIPNFRPIDRDRTQEERPNGTSLPEQAFLTIMFTGVVTNAVRTSPKAMSLFSSY